MGNSQPTTYWRTLDELAGDAAFEEQLQQEFPSALPAAGDGPSRREFLRLMGASIALGGITGCVRQPDEKIVPYVETPEQVVPGKPLFYATAMPHGGYGTGILVESHMGRPTKVEGNPNHPASLGATDLFAQAAVLELYDPSRSQVVKDQGQISNWSAFFNRLRGELAALKAVDGAGLHVLAEPSTSPTLAAQFVQFREAFPQAKWHVDDAFPRENSRAGARMAFAADVRPVYDFTQPATIVSLDADFLVDGPGHARHARQFMQRRAIDTANPALTNMNRLYAVESTPTLTGAAADHRWGMRPGEIEAFARALAREVGVTADGLQDGKPASIDRGTLRFIADDLRKEEGGLVIAGESQPPAVHALAHAINEELGAVGVSWIDAVDAVSAEETGTLGDLVAAMESGNVDVLLILGGNPVFTSPRPLQVAQQGGFAAALAKVPLSAHHSLYYDETSAACRWHVPAAHFLETWSDIRAFDGTATIMQPLIAPLYDGKSVHDVLAGLLGETDRSSRAIVQDTCREAYDGDDFDTHWQTALHDGVVPDSAASPRAVDLVAKLELAPRHSEKGAIPGSTASDDAIDIVFRPDPTIGDGRFANNGWLQELPKPFTKLTWGNAALCSPALAERLGLENEEVVEVSHGDASIEVPVWILPGQPAGVVTLHVGHGRMRAGEVGNGVGVDVTPLRSAASPWLLNDVTLKPTGVKQPLASTQRHHLVGNRDLIRSGTIDEVRAHPQHPAFMRSPHHEEGQERSSFYPEREHAGPQWGMSVNLSACTGCNACVIACQAENNIPVVGREGVSRGREMHWLRIDTYYKGPEGDPETFHQPVMCMHCEHAPCEPVCPVAATTHSDEGLNEMTYNRCVGTRYCSNNCPYKVRRFNYLDYRTELKDEPLLQLLQNPDVTVRSRGVMEKCTYCVQRISAARIEAGKEGRDIREGEVVTACQAVCPTRAIVFGNLSDPESAVSKEKSSPLDYALLAELNTRPRTTYLAAVKNPHPDL